MTGTALVHSSSVFGMNMQTYQSFVLVGLFVHFPRLSLLGAGIALTCTYSYHMLISVQMGGMYRARFISSTNTGQRQQQPEGGRVAFGSV